MVNDRDAIADAIDRFGGDPSAWPDAALAASARATAAADPVLRAYLDDAAALDRALSRARDDLDRDIASGGGLRRVAAGALAAIEARRRMMWMAAAAVLVAAAGLGALADVFLATAPAEPVEFVLLDPLVFAPLEAGQP